MGRRRRGRNVRVTQLNVRGPGGSKVRVTCTRGCRTFNGTIRRGLGIKTLRIASLRNRILLHRADVRVFITRPGAIGTHIRFKIRNGAVLKGPRQCLPPGSFSPGRCP